MKRTIGAILFVIYSIIAILVTVLLLSYNDYNCSVIGGYTVYIVKDDALEPEYNQGSILLVKSTSDKHVQVGDELFFYRVINSQEFEVVNRKLEKKTQQGRRLIYGVEDEESYETSYFIGKADDTIVINGPWGTLLSILESKWGYLFCIVIVSLLLFLQEVFDLIIEIKYGGTKGTKAAHTANARKAAKKSGSKKTTTKTSTAKSVKTATTAVKKEEEKVVEEVAKTDEKTTDTNNTQEGVEKEG